MGPHYYLPSLIFLPFLDFLLKLIANYQLIRKLSAVCHFFRAVCRVILRYSQSKSEAKQLSQSRNKISIFLKILSSIFFPIFRGPKGAPFDQFRCSQWSQVITLGGPKRFLSKNHEKKFTFSGVAWQLENVSAVALYVCK